MGLENNLLFCSLQGAQLLTAAKGLSSLKVTHQDILIVILYIIQCNMAIIGHMHTTSHT